jgi:hypothetical protein
MALAASVAAHLVEVLGKELAADIGLPGETQIGSAAERANAVMARLGVSTDFHLLQLPSVQAVAAENSRRKPAGDGVAAAAAACGFRSSKELGGSLVYTSPFDGGVSTPGKDAKRKKGPARHRGRLVYEWDGRGLPPLVQLPMTSDGRLVVPERPNESDALRAIDTSLARGLARRKRTDDQQQEYEEILAQQLDNSKLTHNWTDQRHGSSYLSGLKPLGRHREMPASVAASLYRRIQHTSAASIAAQARAVAGPASRSGLESLSASSAAVSGLGCQLHGPAQRRGWRRRGHAVLQLVSTSSVQGALSAGQHRLAMAGHRLAESTGQLPRDRHRTAAAQKASHTQSATLRQARRSLQGAASLSPLPARPPAKPAAKQASLPVRRGIGIMPF